MGTRSLTVLVDGNRGREIAVLYRQMDGYPDGHGRELAEFLAPIRMVNGIGRETKAIANGPDCLAAQIIAHFKKDPGGFYLHPAKTRSCGEDFIYHVVASTEKGIELEVESGYKDVKSIFKGTPSDFLKALDEGKFDDSD